jgi:Tfp pilus assembly protein PilF
MMPSTIITRASSTRRKGDDNTARRQLEKAVTKDKSLSAARLELARVLIRQGDVNSALGQCNMVIQQDQKNVDAYLTRAMVHEAKLDYPSAINDVSTAILLEPAGPAALYPAAPITRSSTSILLPSVTSQRR